MRTIIDGTIGAFPRWGRRFGLVIAAITAIGTARAAVILQDDFNGTSGNPPNASNWIASAGVTLNGSGAAQFDLTGGVQNLEALSGFGFTPTTGNYGSMTWDLTDVSGGFKLFGINDGAFSGSSTHILIRNDEGNGAYTVSVQNGTGTEKLFPTSVSSSSVTGVWQINWSTTEITVAKDGTTVFDTSLNAPQGGGSWTIPSVNMEPGIVTYNGTGVTLDANSALWQSVATVPEPSSIVLLLGGGMVALLWRKNLRRV